MKSLELSQLVEALLFAAGEPLSATRLADTLELAEEDVVAALDTLRTQLESRGLRLSHLEGQYQLVTAPDAAQTIERYLGQEARSDLSRPALETLAIIIYQQPVTKSQIDDIRGIASDQTIRNLLQRDLITTTERSREAGRQPLYRPSLRLLQHLGITSLDELPTLQDLQAGADAA